MPGRDGAEAEASRPTAWDRVVSVLRRPYDLLTRPTREMLPFTTTHDSMRPTLEPGDLVWVLPIDRCGEPPLGRGDIVAFQSWHEGEGAAMKRVIAVPGEELAIRAHQVLIDGAVLEEPYATPPTHGVVGPLRLGPGEYFLMGDNRGQSCDSRVHGPVTGDRLIGRAIFRSRPWRRMGYL